MKVVGTAGHIDHGKSTLVHRLTGIDPDRLAEEKRRGMTIDLGFAWLTLPSGLSVSIVDVPGHERFVKNMLAGAVGIDSALLVVAADESVMPQTREHVDIVDLLGVQSGVVALTKADLVDDEIMELASLEVAELLQGTGLQGSPIVPVSAVTGRGTDDLLRVLDSVVADTPEDRDEGLPYLPVDRVFTISGFGTVVTGTLHGGALRTGGEIEILPGHTRGRIRGLQTHRKGEQEARPGTRVAVNLSGVSKEDVSRGDVLVLPGTARAATRFDARLRVLPSAPFPLTHTMQVSLHIGTAERTATLSVLERDQLEPGEEGWVQLRSDGPVAAVRGQRFILRLPSPARTVAGGEVVDVAPRHRRADPRALQTLEALSSPSLDVAVLAALSSDRPRTPPQLAATLGVSRDGVMAALGRLGDNVIRLNHAYLRRDAVDAAGARVARDLAAYHAAHPLRRGMPREELRRRVRVDAAEWPALVRLLTEHRVMRDDGATVALPTHQGGTEARREEAERILSVLRQEPQSPPGASEVLRAAGSTMEVLAALVEDGSAVRVSTELYFDRAAYDAMVCRVVAALSDGASCSVAELRDLLGTSRKYALALLEHLDGLQVTRRVGDTRVLGSRAPACV